MFRAGAVGLIQLVEVRVLDTGKGFIRVHPRTDLRTLRRGGDGAKSRKMRPSTAVRS